MIGDRVFVNNATMGLYAKIVQSPEYRDQKARTALDMLPEMIGPHAEPFDLRFTLPDGSTAPSAHLILVSNGRYQLSKPEGFGSRRSIDGGTLGIVAATFRDSKELARFIQLFASGKEPLPGLAGVDGLHFRGAFGRSDRGRHRRGGDDARSADPIPFGAGGAPSATTTARTRILAGRVDAATWAVRDHGVVAYGPRRSGADRRLMAAQSSA